MNYKKVAVFSVDMRKFVQALLELGSVGGVITDECVAVKGIMPRAEVLVPEGQAIKESENIQVMKAATRARAKQEAVVYKNREYTKEELEAMSLKDLKDLTGAKGRDKESLINTYFEQKGVAQAVEDSPPIVLEE